MEIVGGTLIEAEIAELKGLIELYEMKLEVMRARQAGNQSGGDNRNSRGQKLLIDSNQIEQIIETQDTAFGGAKDENQVIPRHDLATVSQFVERQVYSIPGEAITAFEFATIKPLGRSPQNHLVPTAVIIAFENGIIKVFDVHYSNIVLFELVVGKDIIQVGSSSSQDDMFIVALTKDGFLYVYEVVLERKFPAPGSMDEEARKNSGSGRRQKQAQSSMIDDTNTLGKYKSLMKLYEYKTKAPWIFDMNKGMGSEEEQRTYDSFITVLSKGDKYIMVADSQGYVTTFKGRGDKLSGFDKKNRVFTG